MWYYILGFCEEFMQIHKRNAFLIYTYSGRKDQICLLRKTQVYKMLHYIIIFRINLQAEREEGLGCSKHTPKLDFYFSLYIQKSPIYSVYFHRSLFLKILLDPLIFVLDSHILQTSIFSFYFQDYFSTDFLHGMKKFTWDNFRYFILKERCFYLLLCNLFQK